MPDFMATFTTRYSGGDLLSLLKEPYMPKPPDGFAFDYTWGSLAVLEDHYGQNNIRLENDMVIFWLGDFACDMTDKFVNDLIASLQEFRLGALNPVRDSALSKLNGAFVFGIADNDGLCMVTDPRSFLSTYAAFNEHDCVCVGSHLDLVAAVVQPQAEVNMTYAAEFLNFGTVCFPNTIYDNVKRLEGATIFNFSFDRQGTLTADQALYWNVPDELESGYNEDDLVEELREILAKAVYNRSRGGRVAVTLSGGLDSRLILAQVPRSVECDAITCCDVINRETRIASQIAQACSRPWQPYFRSEDYISESIEQTVKYIGCEGLFVYAHMIGIADRLKNAGYSSILSGTQMDTYLKAYYAQDIVCKRDFWSLRPQLVKVPFDFIYGMTSFWKGVFSSRLIEDVYDSRKQYYNMNVDASRGSLAEWLFLNPVDMMLVSFKAERRVMPTRFVALDKSIVEFCFKCPIHLKMDRRIYLQAALPLFGSAGFIPTADKGTVPASGQLAKLTRRAVRKIIDSTNGALASIGIEPTVQHSWHDYQRYWRQSPMLRGIVRRYAPNLEQLNGPLFNIPGPDLLDRMDIEWHHAFRLLQFAVWLEVAACYRANIRNRPAHPVKRGVNHQTLISR